MRMPTPRLAAFMATMPLAVALVACSTAGPLGPSPTVTATAMPSASVVQVIQSQHFADSKSGGTATPCANGEPLINGDCGVTVTATCAGGDMVLSGGYLLDDPLAFVTSSYPSSATAWTVTAHDEGQDGGSHPVTVTVAAQCLHATFSAGLSTISAMPSIPADSNPREASVSCPAGSVLTGGGFRATNGTDESVPASNGWTASLSIQLNTSAQPAVFAVCATQRLSAAATQMTTSDPAVGHGADLNVSCPAATLLVGGGAHVTGNGTITALTANSALTQWKVHTSSSSFVSGPPGTYSLADYAICVTPLTQP